MRMTANFKPIFIKGIPGESYIAISSNLGDVLRYTRRARVLEEQKLPVHLGYGAGSPRC